MINTPVERVRGAQSIQRAMALLRSVAAAGTQGARLVEIAASSGLARGTVHRILTALASEDLIVRDAVTQAYRLGQEAYVLGTIDAIQHGIHHIALPALHRLAETCDDAAFLSVPSGTDFVCVHRQEGKFKGRNHWLKAGDRHPLGVGSPGQALLAAMSDPIVNQCIALNAEAVAQRYPAYSVIRMLRLVADARARGYAVSPGLVWPGACGIAVAIVNNEGRPIGALSVAAAENRLHAGRYEKLGALLSREAKWISRQLY